MQIPAVGFIEMGAAQLKSRSQEMVKSELREFNLFATREAEVLKVITEKIGTEPNEFETGFLLGLETARALLAGMPAAVLNKVSI